MDSTRQRLLALIVTITLTGCAMDSGWNESTTNQLRTEMCEEAGISPNSLRCDCLVGVVLDFFDTPSDFSRSTSAPDGFIERFARC